MKKLTFVFLFTSIVSYSQQQTFDITTFIPPQGWSNELKDFATSFSTTNSLTRGWCRATIYKSIRSSGNAATDFTNEWAALIKKNYPDAELPTPQSTTEDGWTIEAGGSKFQFNNQEAGAMLTTISGYGVEVSVVVLFNNDEFMNAVEKFFESIHLQKPAPANESTKVTTTSNQPTPAALPVSEAPSNSGISISATNFDDGWIARPYADYVKVTKGEIVVSLHYAIAVTDEMRNSNDVLGSLLNQLIVPRYEVSNVRKYDNGGACYFCIDFLEADVVEKSTGKKYYVGFRVITNSGISRCIEIITPSSSVMQNEFSDQKKIESMLNYNKFAIKEADLLGTWESSSGAAVNLYNAYTGAYAGMNTSSSADKFTFKPNGLYESNHKGAFGMVGSMQFYDQKYNGNSIITNWDLTLTKRFKDKTEIFWAQFEAVRGGRVLHLTNKQYSGNTYQLVKTK